MFEDPFTDDPDDLSIKDAIKSGHPHFLTASIPFGKILDIDGEPLVYDFAECFKEMNDDTLRDFYKRVMDDGCDLIAED